MDGTIRIRSVAWFATAVVLTLVCTLLVTQAWSVGAAPGDDDSTFVPTAGCRVTDTRSAPDTVGPRSTPLGADSTFTVAIHGSNGECTGPLAIPTDAVGVALNVTAVNATASSNIRIFPANLTEVPTLSNLNVTAGAAPLPNKVDVKLSPDGKIKVYNANGSVNIVIDIVGYYTNATLQELSQRVVALEAAQAAGVDPAVLARLDAVEAKATTNAMGVSANSTAIAALELSEPFAVGSVGDSSRAVDATGESINSVTLTAPVDGQVTVNSSALLLNATAGQAVRCVLNDTPADNLFYEQLWESAGANGDRGSLSGSRTFDITSGTSQTYHLFCKKTSGPNATTTVYDNFITAIFTPAP